MSSLRICCNRFAAAMIPISWRSSNHCHWRNRRSSVGLIYKNQIIFFSLSDQSSPKRSRSRTFDWRAGMLLCLGHCRKWLDAKSKRPKRADSKNDRTFAVFLPRHCYRWKEWRSSSDKFSRLYARPGNGSYEDFGVVSLRREVVFELLFERKNLIKEKQKKLLQKLDSGKLFKMPTL